MGMSQYIVIFHLRLRCQLPILEVCNVSFISVLARKVQASLAPDMNHQQGGQSRALCGIDDTYTRAMEGFVYSFNLNLYDACKA